MELLSLLSVTTSLIAIWLYRTNKVTKAALAKAESNARYWKGCTELYRIAGVNEDDFIVEAYENYIDKLFDAKINK